MTNDQSARALNETNPFAQMLQRMTGLAGYWATGSTSPDDANPIGSLTHSLEESRAIVNDAIRRQLEITANAQKRIVDRFAALAAARSPQELWFGQLEILTTIAEASSEHSAVWADSCRSMRERCGSTLRADQSSEHPSDEQSASRSTTVRTRSGQSTSRVDQHVKHAAAGE